VINIEEMKHVTALQVFDTINTGE